MKSNQKTILIIDDNKTFVMYVGLLLKRMGFEIIPANSGLEGLKLLKMLKPDVVLLDINMPEIDGFTLLRQFKADEETSHIPVIMASVDSSKKTYDKCVYLGCSGYLNKPVTIDKLHQAMQNIITFAGGKKRQHLRTQLHKKVQVEIGATHEELYAVTLSEGGIYLRKKEPLEVGTQLTVHLDLPGGQQLQLIGEVIYRREIFQTTFRIEPGMAVRFTELKPDEAAAIKKYITYLLAGDIVEEQDEPVIHVDD